MVLNDVAELLAIGRAAARIRIEHDITLRRHPLKFVIENVAVSRVRPAVNVQDERIFLAGSKSGGFCTHAWIVLAVKTLVPNLFRLGQIQLGEQLVVDMRQLLRLASPVARSRTRDR